jgi:phosphoglucomutase
MMSLKIELSLEDKALVEKTRIGTMAFLNGELKAGRIEQGYYQFAVDNVIPNLISWLSDTEIDKFSPNLREGIRDAIREELWQKITNTYVSEIKFGTGGIRGRMAFDKESILKMKKEGLGAKIFKGPGTFNDKVVLLKSVGVARYMNEKNLKAIVIGYDSRVRGQDIAVLIAELFLGYGIKVYFFDEACPYPEVTFAIPDVRADAGILISASHNDYRYNGYKLSCGNGSQFDPEERDEIYEKYIVPATTDQIKLCKFKDATPDLLYFLGGAKPLPDFDYLGREDKLINMHEKHVNHVMSFLLRPDMIKNQKNPLKIAFCAFNGAGRKAVPAIFEGTGFGSPRIIKSMNELDGLFPAFCSEPGKEQQPDPGDFRSADIAVKAFKEEYPGEFKNIDILIGTDPDADRCGVIVQVPENQRDVYGGREYTLLPADDAWCLVLWYRLKYEIEKFGKVQDAEKKFIVQSHTTSDAIIRLCMKYGIGVVRTFVGFAMLAAGVQKYWDKEDVPKFSHGRLDPDAEKCDPVIMEIINMSKERSFNIGAMEQSNGFSLLGGPPKDKRSLGENGHVRDKDGTFAALLVAEVAAWAKENGTTLLEILDKEICLDPDVGLIFNYYEPDPMDGEFEGLAGYTKKKNVLIKAKKLMEQAQNGELEICGLKATSSYVYKTGKYDAANWPGFPDEGFRFYFENDDCTYLTIRPSGTSNALRFHFQIKAKDVTEKNLIEKKKEIRVKARAVIAELRVLIGAEVV